MAATSTRTVDLGTVGFGLVADTTSLQASLNTLKEFGRLTNAMSKDTGEGVQQLYNKYANIEKVLTSLQARVVATTTKMKEAGVAQVEIDKVTAAYERLNRTLTQNAQAISKHEMSRGTVGMSAIIGRGNALAGGEQINTMAAGLRNLERAAMLAAGPLSGIGFRLAVITSLFESSTAKMALFIGGTALAATGLGLMIAASIRATIEMQKFQAILLAATGAEGLTGDAFSYVSEQANKLGLNIRGLVEPYAKFATSARLAQMSLADQRTVFEGATTAGAAMHLSAERLGLVFLALEESMSKGIITEKELRRQLGNELPGSFELAANAMGVTRAQLVDLIRKGEVLSSDLLPKLGAKWLEVFGPAAAKAAQNLQGQMQRTGTLMFELEKSFDMASGSSKAFTSAVKTFNEILVSLASHMQGILTATITLAGAGGILGLIMVMEKAVVGINALVKVLVEAKVAMLALGGATTVATGGLSLVITNILKFVAVALGTEVAFDMMNKGFKSNIEQGKNWADDAQIWIDQQKKIGVTSAQTAEEMSKAAIKKMEAIDKEILANQKALELALIVKDRSPKPSVIRTTWQLVTELKFGTKGPAPTSDPNEEINATKKKLDELQHLRNDLYNVVGNIKTLTLQEPEKPAGPSTQWLDWVKKIRKDLREYQMLQDEIKATSKGGASDDAIRTAKATKAMLDLMAEEPEGKRSSYAEISKSLKEAGFSVGTFKDQLVAMFAASEKGKTDLQTLVEFPKKYEAAAASASKMFEELYARQGAIKAVDPKAYKDAEDLTRSLDTLRGHMEAMRLTESQMVEMTKLFTDTWKDTKSLDETAKKTLDLRNRMIALQDTLGTPMEKAAQKTANALRDINDAESMGVFKDPTMTISAFQLRQRASDDYYKEAYSRATIFGQSMHTFFDSLANDIAKTWVDILNGGKSTWSSLFLSLEKMIEEFLLKVAVIQPMMTKLFGAMYNKEASPGSGLLEGLIGSFVGVPKLPSAAASPSGPTANLVGLGLEAGTLFGAGVMPSFDVGTDYVPRDMVAQVHQGEKITPASENTGGGMGKGNYNFTMNVDASGSKLAGDHEGSAQLGRKLETAVRGVLINERRPGGLLAG